MTGRTDKWTPFILGFASVRQKAGSHTGAYSRVRFFLNVVRPACCPVWRVKALKEKALEQKLVRMARGQGGIAFKFVSPGMAGGAGSANPDAGRQAGLL